MVTPVILVTADRTEGTGLIDSPRVRPARSKTWVKEFYIEAVRVAGGLPLIVPSGECSVAQLLEIADGILLTGGHFDIHPSHYGEEAAGRIDRVDIARTSLELGLAKAAIEGGVPVLGICGGMQAMAVATGGSLIQDLPQSPINHEQPTDDALPWHPVRVDASAEQWLGKSVMVNSTHHQAVREPGAALMAAGWCTQDEVIEVIVSRDPARFAVGVQWHPEALGDYRLYRALIDACRG